MSVAAPLVLRPGDGARLRELTRSSAAPAGHVQRARMVLLAAEGLPNAEIGRRVGMTRQTVIAWRARYAAGGIEALVDLPRSGRPPTVDEAGVVVATLNPPPPKLGVTHWSARLLSDHLARAGTPVSFAEVARIWRDWNLQPHRVETFKFSTDPHLEAKIRDVVGLYLDPPTNAVVVCVDEKSQIQALDRTAPLLPIRFDQAERRTHDYKRHGTTTLFAALEVATGKITADACYPRHRNGEFLAFLKQVAKAHPRIQLHVVCDNYAAHNHPNVNAWLAKNPRITLHFTPTGASWMNLVEIFFGIITRQAIRRGTFTSVPDLIGAIRTFIDAYNQRCQPFTWTKTAEQILAKATRPRLVLAILVGKHDPRGVDERRAVQLHPQCLTRRRDRREFHVPNAGIRRGVENSRHRHQTPTAVAANKHIPHTLDRLRHHLSISRAAAYRAGTIDPEPPAEHPI